MFAINKKNNYLLVEFKTDVTFEVICQAIHMVMQHPEYKNLNDIYVFNDLPVYLEYENLEEITRIFERSYPEEATRDKTAIIVTSPFSKALAEMWKGMASRLPYEVGIFEELDEAVEWVTKSSH